VSPILLDELKFSIEYRGLPSVTTKTRSFALLLALALTPSGWGAAVEVSKPGPTDRCPVCGMFVARYPEWIATVVYQDGHSHYFDGAKDLFKYLTNLPRWAPGHRVEDQRLIAVTEYYGTTAIEATQAFYVIGSDVLGPMGHELIPLTSREEAEEFLRDHKGRRVLRYQEVTPEWLERIDQGRFE